MNCNNAKELLLSYLDNELSPLEIVSIEDHLSSCPGCRAELEALAETKRELCQAFETIAASASPSPHAWENIKHQLTKEGHRSDSILSPAKSIIRGWTGILKLPRPVWQTLGALSVALLIVLSLTLPSSPINSPVAADQLKKFSSYDELKVFVKKGSQSNDVSRAVRFAPSVTEENTGDEPVTDPYVWAGGLDSATSSVPVDSTEDYSTTNIQVQGVDEVDIVKTDGEFIYLASDSKVTIARAYPASEARVLTEIDQDESIAGIFIQGDRLVVICQNYNNLDGSYYGNLRLFIPESAEIYAPQTYINIYDISDRENPVLTRDMSIDGNYFGSRMIGNYVYMIVNASACQQDNEIELPAIHLDGTDIKIDATDIYYTNIADDYYSFTTIAAVNVKKDEQKPEYETILLGATSNLYVSLNNIYITSAVYTEKTTIPETQISDDYINGTVAVEVTEWMEKTTIQRIHIAGGHIKYQASGEVSGKALNQFSMDEYMDYFRIVTTANGSEHSVYILDENLDITGKLQDFAPQGERFHSARFAGDRCYLVTFRNTDPLFVVDLSNPNLPQVLGELEITGYSDYLHSYDENHLIGIGKEATASGLFHGVKISLFDVSDFNNPKEIAKYEIGDRGTESPVLDDHKALLFNKSRNLLVLPVLVSEGSYNYTWQGAYVFHISPEEGLVLRGKITHCENEDDLQGSLYSPGDSWIERSLYIKDVLYTISDAKIGMNDLENLNELGEILLP